MEKKDERPSNRVPAGTFGASDPPPTRRSDPGTRSAALAEGVAHSSAPPAPPARDSDPDAADRKRYTSTLMGHGTPPGSDGVPPPVAPVLSPPKWRGAKAYLEGQEPKPRVSTIAATAPIADAELAASAIPAGTRVNTKLGTPPAPPVPTPVPVPQSPSVQDISDPAIDQAIERMLEGQTSVPMEVESADPDLDALEELPIEEVVDEPSERAVPLARLALKTAAARVPVSAPIEARAREQPGDQRVDAVPAAPVASTPPPAPSTPSFDVELGAPAPPSIDLAPQPAAALDEPAAPASPSERPGERASRSAAGEPEQYGASDTPSALAELRTRRSGAPAPHGESRSNEKAPAAASSGLAAATSGKVGTSPRAEQHLALGSGLLALMVLFGFGGWYLTRGGFQRSVAPASALAEPTAVPKPEPLVPVVPKGLVQPAPALPATPPPPTAPSATVAQPAHDSHDTHATRSRDSHASDSHASDGHASVRRDSEPQRPSVDSTQPPVLRVVPQSTKPASEGPSETPTRAEVLAALEPLRPAVARCVQGQHGIAQLDITVINTGAVTHAVVAGDFAGTPEGSCIALAARDAKFAPFQKPRFRVIFPFSL